jgi:CheY-specific phosphatase CheX
MSSSWEGPLLQATALTFEELGLVLPGIDLTEEQRAAPWEAVVEIGFRGPLVGSLVLAVAGDILPTIVANMLGGEGIDTLKARHDALGELGNVICGNALPTIAGVEATFDIEPPKVIDPVVMRDRSKFDAAVCIGLAAGRAEVCLRARAAGGQQPGRRVA